MYLLDTKHKLSKGDFIMKKRILLICSIFLFVYSAFAQDPVLGHWISFDDKTGKATAGWFIEEINVELFGTMTALADHPQDQLATGGKGKSYSEFQNGKDIAEIQIVGTTWIYNLKKDDTGKWSKGYIIDPESGNRYKCKITFRKADGKKYKTDTLEMRGELALGIGRSQFWTRASEEEAKNIR